MARSLLEQVLAQAAQLTPAELDELLLALAGLREARQPTEAKPPEAAALTSKAGRSGRGSRGGRGHLEQKWINGCGPYLYLRYYKGCEQGKSRYGSVYLGKVSQDSNNASGSRIQTPRPS